MANQKMSIVRHGAPINNNKMRFLALSFLVAVGATAPVLADNFAASCDTESIIIDGPIVKADCRTVVGGKRCSRLDLSLCLKNTYGAIQDDPEGKGPRLGDQCINCSNAKTAGILVSGPTLLHCQCNPGNGADKPSWPVALFDINTMMDNVDGYMKCHGHVATQC